MLHFMTYDSVMMMMMMMMTRTQICIHMKNIVKSYLKSFLIAFFGLKLEKQESSVRCGSKI